MDNGNGFRILTPQMFNYTSFGQRSIEEKESSLVMTQKKLIRKSPRNDLIRYYEPHKEVIQECY